MIDDICILTIGDFSALTALQQQWSARDHDLAPILRRKLHDAKVVFQNDLPRNVATLGSQIAYSIDNEEFTHTLTCMTGIDARWLPISLPLGLALLGQREGKEMVVHSEQNGSRRVRLSRVLDQPEASWPGRFMPAAGATYAPPLRLVHSSASLLPSTSATSGEEDDPGPAAA